jgi:hypothetical protein
MAKKPVLDVKGLDETQKAALYAKIGEWQKAKSKAAEWTAKEMDLRKEIVAEFFPADCEEGKNNMKLEWGKQLGFTRVINRSVEKVQLKAALELEAAKKAADPTYKSNILPIIDEVIQYEPKVSVSAYKELSEESRLLIADIVTVKEGAPTLALETPKT